MKAEKIIIRFEGEKKFYDLIKEYVVYEIERDNNDYNSLNDNIESTEINIDNPGTWR